MFLTLTSSVRRRSIAWNGMLAVLSVAFLVFAGAVAYAGDGNGSGGDNQQQTGEPRYDDEENADSDEAEWEDDGDEADGDDTCTPGVDCGRPTARH
jgi:hypothetical protein